MRIPALTIWQPFASLILLGEKVFETRCWPTAYRGPVLIHAAGAQPANDLCRQLANRHFPGIQLPRRQFLGICQLIDCTPCSKLDPPAKYKANCFWRPENFAFHLADPCTFVQTDQWKAPGNMGLWYPKLNSYQMSAISRYCHESQPIAALA